MKYLAALALAGAGCGGPFTMNPFLGGPANVTGGWIGPIGGNALGEEGWNAAVGVPVSSTRDVHLSFESMYEADDWVNRASIEYTGLAQYEAWEGGWFWRVGWAAHWDELDGWGTGPRLSGGYGSLFAAGGVLGVEICAGLYVWAGEEDGDPAGGIAFDYRVNLRVRLGRRSEW